MVPCRILLAAAAAVLLATRVVAGPESRGEPGSAERRAWCAQAMEDCLAPARNPGYLGGPAEYCDGQAKAGDCLSVCALRFGPQSDCMTEPSPH
jgi:hypothetical protein